MLSMVQVVIRDWRSRSRLRRRQCCEYSVLDVFGPAIFSKAIGLVTGWHGYCRVSVSVAKDGPSEAEAGTHLAFGDRYNGF